MMINNNNTIDNKTAGAMPEGLTTVKVSTEADVKAGKRAGKRFAEKLNAAQGVLCDPRRLALAAAKPGVRKRETLAAKAGYEQGFLQAFSCTFQA